METTNSGMPMIKCSDCGKDVSIATIGEHVCAEFSDDAPPPPPPKTEEEAEAMPTTSTLRFFRDNPSTKSMRAPPPRIDPLAANRPFLDSDPNRVPAINAPSPFSQSPSPSTNMNFSKPQRSQTTPLFSTPGSPDSNYQDSTFSLAQRGRSKTFDNNNSRPDSPSTFNTESPWPATHSEKDDPQTAVSDQARPEEEVERKRRHRREASMDSKSIFKLSPSELSNLANISPSLKGGRNVMDEVPPLPSGPIKSFSPSPYAAAPSPYTFDSKEEFDNDRNVSTSPPKDNREGGNFSGLNFGLPTNPKPTNGHVEDSMGHKRQFSKPSSSYAGSERTGSRGEREEEVPSYRVDEDFSVSSFARGLGLGDPYHAPNESTSSTHSGSAPSEGHSGSSFSSRPSDGTTVSGSKLPQDAAARQRGHGDSLDSELKPPQPPYEQYPDSPTDPFFSNSGPSKPKERPQDLKVDTQRIPLPPEPKSAGPRTPGSRPASRGPRAQCRGCGETITGKSITSADGRLTGRYHKACFVCQVCNSPFKTADFYILNNNPYCAQHYHQLNGTLCAGCNVGIEGPCRQTEDPESDESPGSNNNNNALGPRNQRFHPDCFKCRTCRMVLDGDYFDWEGQVYCERDGRRAALAAQAHMMPPPPPSPGPYGRRPPPPGYGGPPPRGGGPPPRGRGPRRGPGPPLPPHPHGHGPRRGGGPPGGPPGGNRLAVPGPGGPGGPGPGPRFPEKRTTKLLMI